MRQAKTAGKNLERLPEARGVVVRRMEPVQPTLEGAFVPLAQGKT